MDCPAGHVSDKQQQRETQEVEEPQSQTKRSTKQIKPPTMDMVLFNKNSTRPTPEKDNKKQIMLSCKSNTTTSGTTN